LLKMVYEDGTSKIDMLDPKRMLESGLEKAMMYSRRINASINTHSAEEDSASKPTVPFKPVLPGSSSKNLRSAA